jgi:uracil-DNA glycosylase
MTFDEIRQQIIDDPENATSTASGILPLYTAGPGARIALVGQAPGRKAEESGIAWDDASGVKLKSWLGVGDGRCPAAPGLRGEVAPEAPRAHA